MGSAQRNCSGQEAPVPQFPDLKAPDRPRPERPQPNRPPARLPGWLAGWHAWTRPSSSRRSQPDPAQGWNSDATARRYSNRFPGDYQHCETTGHAVTYGAAAGVGGIGIKAETTHSTTVQQCIHAGSAVRDDALTGKHDGWHIIWGTNHILTHNPKTFYSC
jgi:hypothetical protein